MTKPVVSVIMTHHLDENRPYLDRALDGILRSQGVPFEVILLADSETCPDAPENVTVVHDKALNTAVKKGHHGIKMAQGDYFLFHSDDVIASSHAMANLVRCGDWSIVNAMSNSDQGTRFSYPLALKRGNEFKVLHPDSDLEEMRGWESAIHAYESPIGQLVVRQDWTSFFFTLIPRKVWDAVGLMDERLETRHNDEDYCYRARALGILPLIHFGAFAFHYGTKTLNKSVKPGEQDEATRVFREKWHGRQAS